MMPKKLLFVFSLGLTFSLWTWAETLPASKSPLFKSKETIEVNLKADFSDLFTKFKNLPVPQGRQSDNGPEAFVPGEISYRDQNGDFTSSIPVSVRVRGHSSMHDCTFPKMILVFDKNTDRSNTIFKNMEDVKIATHCDDVEGLSGGYSRLRNQKEPHREALLYQILETFEVPSFKARGALINYINTGNNDNVTTRNAAFIESTHEFGKRFKATQIFFKGTGEAMIAEREAAKKGKTLPGYIEAEDASKYQEATNKINLAQSFIENSDWHMDFSMSYFWNIKAFMTKEGKKIFIPFDFDLARLATQPEHVYVNAPNINRIQAVQSFSDKMSLVEKQIDEADFTYVDLYSHQKIDDTAAKALMKTYAQSMADQYKQVLTQKEN